TAGIKKRLILGIIKRLAYVWPENVIEAFLKFQQGPVTHFRRFVLRGRIVWALQLAFVLLLALRRLGIRGLVVLALRLAFVLLLALHRLGIRGLVVLALRPRIPRELHRQRWQDYTGQKQSSQKADCAFQGILLVGKTIEVRDS